MHLGIRGLSTDGGAPPVLSRCHAKFALKDSAKRWYRFISDAFGDAGERERLILKKLRCKLQPPAFEIGHRSLSDERGKARSER